MQAAIETRKDGSVAIELDPEAAQAMVASIVFAARFHERIVSLAGMVEAGIRNDKTQPARRTLCQ
jgi:hypothetical protein